MRGLAITSLILGIIGFFLSFLFGLGFLASMLAVIFGIIPLTKKISRAISLSGLVLGILGITISISFFWGVSKKINQTTIHKVKESNKITKPSEIGPNKSLPVKSFPMSQMKRVHVINITNKELKETSSGLAMIEQDAVSGLKVGEHVQVNLPTEQGHLLFGISDITKTTKFHLDKKVYYPEIGKKYLWLKLRVSDNSYTKINTNLPIVYVRRDKPQKFWSTYYQIYYKQYYPTSFSGFSGPDEFSLSYFLKPNSQDEAWIIYEIPYEAEKAVVRWRLIKNKVASWDIKIP